MLTYILLFFTFLFLIHIIFNYNYKSRLIRRIPGPEISFIVGHAWKILNLTPAATFNLARTYAKKYNDIYAVYSFPLYAVSILTPEDVEIVLSSITHHQKGYAYNFMKPWLRDGLLLSHGMKWQQRRKILTPAFHFNVLKRYFEVVKENSQDLIETISKASGKIIDLKPAMSEYTLNTICETAMGVKLNKELTPEFLRDYEKAIIGLGDVAVHRLVNAYYVLDILFRLSPMKKLQDECLPIVHNFSKKVIDKRRQTLKDNDTETFNDINTEYVYPKKEPYSMLDLLIAAERDGLIDKEGTQEEVDTFIFGGYDTVAIGLTFCLLSLANEPSIQERIYEEQIHIFGDTDRDLTLKDLSAMRYLELCIKESLRLYPPIPLITRTITEEVKLSNYTVPGNTMCIVHIFDLHRREDIYKNASKFDPDRFLPESCEKRHNYAYIPFSAGPRNCIGQKFAMMQLKSVLSLIIRKFKLVAVTKPSDLKFEADIVLRNKGPVNIKFIKRK